MPLCHTYAARLVAIIFIFCPERMTDVLPNTGSTTSNVVVRGSCNICLCRVGLCVTAICSTTDKVLIICGFQLLLPESIYTSRISNVIIVQVHHVVNTGW